MPTGIKDVAGDFPLKAINNARYQAVWQGQKSWNGIAVLAKGLEIKEVPRHLPGDPDDDHSRYIEVIIDQMLICCLYLPNGNPYPGPKFDYKMAWIKRLKKRAGALMKMDIAVILLGDFNIIPAALDVYQPEKWVNNALYRTEARKEFRQLLRQGWMDAIRRLFPEQQVFTFWNYFRNAYGRNAGLRLDHILLSPQVAPLLIEGGIDRHVRGWEKTSDHARVWIRLDKNKAISSSIT